MKKNISEALIICFLATVIALSVNMMRTDGLKFFSPVSQEVSPDSAPAIRQIEIQAAIDLFNRQAAFFADARPAVDFAAGHIAGAINLPAQEPDQWFETVFANVDPEKTLITYCNGVNCALAKQLALILTEAGFEQVFYLADGWGQWTAHDMPTEKGE